MAHIHLLDNNLIDKIAAGEVVERPASVVKELMENSIDAGADKITVEIEGGGIDLIRITDNGKGIPSEEVETAFMRHATSKLNVIEDLESILTLGFRGEALSSIASVAEVELITKTEDEPIGTKFEVSGGRVGAKTEVGANTGTRLTVRDLFFNTPVRRKFLKKASTEGGYVSEIVNRIALGHPELAVEYIVNGSTVLKTNGNGDLKTTVFYIYGKDITSKLTQVKYSKDGYTIEGYIVKPELGRGNRAYENFFINGRYIKSTVVSEAVEAACKGRLTIGKFPIFVLNLTVPDSTVDVNVHPTKLEVRFSDEGFIYDFVLTAVDKALSEQTLIPKVEWDTPKKEKKPNVEQLEIINMDKAAFSKAEDGIKATEAEIITADKDNALVEQERVEAELADEFTKGKRGLTKEMLNGISDIEPDVTKPYGMLAERLGCSGQEVTLSSILLGGENKEIKPAEPLIPVKSLKKVRVEQEESEAVKADEQTDKRAIYSEAEDKKGGRPFFYDYRIVGQLFSTYWIVEQAGSMYMIDQHAAHERVLYEELTAKLKNREVVSQVLLEPFTVNVTESEHQNIEDNRELLESFGFEFEEFGNLCYAVRSVPYIFTKYDYVGSFIDMIDALSERTIASIYDTKSDAIAMMSCKAAVKAHDRLSEQEARLLIQKLLKLENPFNCPHGRPTIIEMSRYELEKKFKRVQD